MEQTEALVSLLLNRDNNVACAAADALIEQSADSDAVYPYFDRIAQLLSHRNSLARNRALRLLSANARWDADDRFDEIIDAYLTHITDEKPITARQCIQSLPAIAAEKPHLAEKIRAALQNADFSGYADSMRPLVTRDAREALSRISGGNDDG